MSRTFRFAAEPGRAHMVEAALTAQGFASAPLPFYALGRELAAEPFPLGASLAARFGYIYIQDASSMLPALALAGIAQADGASDPLAAPLLALDMCASPGGKTSLLARLLGPRALVLANEPSPKRLATLRRNLELMNEFGTATISHQGQELPLPSAGSVGRAAGLGAGGSVSGSTGMTAGGNLGGSAGGAAGRNLGGNTGGAAGKNASGGEFSGFDYILLDPPCSGWGTVEKHPQVLELWQGERLGPLVGLQRLLLREAARLLRPGGALVYSTCTTNVQENEEQIGWALDAARGLNAELDGALELLPLTPFAGFVFDEPLPPLAGQGVLRVAQEGLGQGFFISALRKGLAAPVLAPRVAAPAKKSRPHGKAQPPGRNIAETRVVPRQSLSSPLCDAELLPPGEIHEQNGVLYFRHAAALAALPAGFNWRGFPLGKNMRPDPALRGLMPPPDEAEARGAAVLNAKDPAEVLALVSGQSLKLETGQSEVGLYLNGLPLCRLKARGGRLFI